MNMETDDSERRRFNAEFLLKAVVHENEKERIKTCFEDDDK